MQLKNFIATLMIATVAATISLTALVVPVLAEDDHDQNDLTSVRRFGAVGNGIHDDTLAFKRAVETTPTGGTLRIPAGKYVLTDTIVVKKAITISGSGHGSQIYGKNPYTVIRLDGVNNAVIRDLYLGSASNAPGVSLLELRASAHIRIDNITMLGGHYGLFLNGALINTIVDLHSGTNFGGFFAPTAVTNTWVWAQRINLASGHYAANANTFIAPVLEGGVNGIVVTDTGGEGSLNITGGTIEGVSGTALTFNRASLSSSVTGVHFEANGDADVIIQDASNIRLSSIVSYKLIALHGDTRNITVSDSIADSVSIDYNSGPIQPTPSGAKRITLQNISTCVTATSSITPPPTNAYVPGPSQSPDPTRPDIIYMNIGRICNGL